MQILNHRLEKVWPFSFLIACVLPLTSLSSHEEEIVVELKTQRKLHLTAVAPFIGESGFSQQHLNNLTQILSFDCNHSGHLKVLRNNLTELDQIVNDYHKEKKIDYTQLKKMGIEYLILPHLQRVSEKINLQLDVIAIKGKKVHHFRPITLIGSLNKDRQAIHLLSDALTLALFQQQGIATTRILYSRRVKPAANSEGWYTEIWESGYDGGNQRCIIKDPHLSLTPIYIPPQGGRATQSFIYTSYATGVPKLLFGTLSSGQGPRVSFLQGNQFTPAISRQGDAIAFISDALGSPDLYIQPLSLSSLTPQTPKRLFGRRGATQASPTFSPDGSSLAFVSDLSGSPQIYYFDLKNPKRITPLTKANRESTNPAWSPDGKYLAYSGRNEGQFRQLWLLDLATGVERGLTFDPQHKENPSWSPNSRFLVYNQITETGTDLRLIDVEFPDRITLLSTATAEEKLFPCWEPR
jgi:TolB protein